MSYGSNGPVLGQNQIPFTMGVSYNLSFYRYSMPLILFPHVLSLYVFFFEYSTLWAANFVNHGMAVNNVWKTLSFRKLQFVLSPWRMINNSLLRHWLVILFNLEAWLTRVHSRKRCLDPESSVPQISPIILPFLFHPPRCRHNILI